MNCPKTISVVNMIQFVVLFVVLSLILHQTRGCSFATPGRKNPHLANIPNISMEAIANPMVDPMACGRESEKLSLVCDPAKIMPIEQANDIDSSILDTIVRTGVNVGVVIIHKMVTKDFENNEIASSTYAQYIHEKWEMKHLGMIIFMSLSEKKIQFLRPDYLKKALTDKFMDKMLSNVDGMLAKENYGLALDKIVQQIQVAMTVPLKSYLMKGDPYIIEPMKAQVIARASKVDGCQHSSCKKEEEIKRKEEELQKKQEEELRTLLEKKAAGEDLGIFDEALNIVAALQEDNEDNVTDEEPTNDVKVIGSNGDLGIDAENLGAAPVSEEL
jgi:hypothetical protein